MSAASFIHEAVPEPFFALGRWLKPLCLGHAVLLERQDSAYKLNPDRPPEFDDLVFAVWVCSRTFEGAEESLRNEASIEEIAHWWPSCKRANPIEEFRIFQNYINTHTNIPKFRVEKRGVSSQRHWAQGIVELLVSEFNMSLSEAWNLPLPMAMRLHLSRLESGGVIRFTGDIEADWDADNERNQRLMEKAQALHAHHQQ